MACMQAVVTIKQGFHRASHLQALLDGWAQLLVAASKLEQLARVPLEGLVVAAEHDACEQYCRQTSPILMGSRVAKN